MKFNAKKHIQNLIKNDYYSNLVKLRSLVSGSIDSYFQKLEAPKIDLYLISKSVSSPTGKGSDSIPLKIKIDGININLVDSAQFGLEPIIINHFDMVYCYLPSFRGEDNDNRHLTQFYHCEAELKGDYNRAIKVATNLVKHITESILSEENKLYKFGSRYDLNSTNYIVDKEFLRVSFDEVDEIFKKKGLSHLIDVRKYGRVLTAKGELAIFKFVGGNKLPIWIEKYDRDVVPFYQKPDPGDKERVLNADLIFPPRNGGFGGEIVGLGQRQDDSAEILESMKRQEIRNVRDYKWYIDLRKHTNYHATSGFGLGIERYLSWVLGLPSIIDAAIYPVVKGRNSYY